MGNRSAPHLTRYLPQVVIATLLVAVCPSIVVWAVRSTGVLRWWGYSVALGIAFSLLSSYAGSAYWKTRAGSEDLLFGEVMLWGWLRRWRVERRLNSAVALLGLGGTPQTPSAANSPARQAQLLAQMAGALEARDPYTHGHSRRVARHAAMIARGMGLARAQVRQIRAAAALHDVGKINTPEEVLQKPGRLSDEEFEVIKRHPVDGAQIVARLGDDELTRIVRHHHERLDGTGYPGRLSGTDIPLGSRIIAVADTFDAITSLRPYRPISPHKRALDILVKEAGTQLDPAAVRAFCNGYAARRPLAAWAVLTSVPERLVAWAGTELNAIGAASALRVMATAATSAAVGSAAVIAPTLTRPALATHPKVRLVADTHTQAPPRPALLAGRAAAATRLPVRLPTPHRSRSGAAPRPARVERPRPSLAATVGTRPAPLGPPRGVVAQAPGASTRASGVPAGAPASNPPPAARAPATNTPSGAAAGLPAAPSRAPTPPAGNPAASSASGGGGAPGGAPAITVPSVGVPGVSVGPIKAPPVSTPSVTVPPVSIPVSTPVPLPHLP